MLGLEHRGGTCRGRWHKHPAGDGRAMHCTGVVQCRGHRGCLGATHGALRVSSWPRMVWILVPCMRTMQEARAQGKLRRNRPGCCPVASQCMRRAAGVCVTTSQHARTCSGPRIPAAASLRTQPHLWREVTVFIDPGGHVVRQRGLHTMGQGAGGVAVRGCGASRADHKLHGADASAPASVQCNGFVSTCSMRAQEEAGAPAVCQQHRSGQP